MLTNIALTNFRAFEELSVDFTPITLILGPNNSGKSSILSAPRLLVQTLESYDARVPLLLNGIFGDFGTYRDLVYSNHRAKRMGLEITVQGGDDNVMPGLRSNDSVTLSMLYKYRTVRREIVLQETGLKYKNKAILATKFSDDSERQLIEKCGSIVVPSSIKSAISRGLRMQNFLPQSVGFFAVRKEAEGPLKDFFDKNRSVENNTRLVSPCSGVLYRTLHNVEYVGAMRVPPARTYLFTGEKRDKVGSTGENAASILALDIGRTGSRARGLIQSVGKWLQSAGMASAIKIESISDRHYEIRVQHSGSKEFQNFADTGFGHSQVLPVLVGGFNLRKGATYLVEQPEIHLHPKAQAELGTFFLDLYQRDIQSIIETHSEHLILRLQQYVANGDIDSKDISFYYVCVKNGRKQVFRMHLDGQGKFIEDWPEGFFPERLEEAKKLAQVRFQRGTQKA